MLILVRFLFFNIFQKSKKKDFSSFFHFCFLSKYAPLVVDITVITFRHWIWFIHSYYHRYFECSSECCGIVINLIHGNFISQVVILQYSKLGQNKHCGGTDKHKQENDGKYHCKNFVSQKSSPSLYYLLYIITHLLIQRNSFLCNAHKIYFRCVKYSEFNLRINNTV